jgi:hypothetical protein
MNRKEKLIQSLSTVISALENDVAQYNWTNQSQCNCGLVTQVLLGKSQTELNDELERQDIFNKPRFKSRIGTDALTWKNAVKVYCPIAKKPLKQIFIDLENAGLSKEDIVHLEYMDNPAIFSKSGIKPTKTVKKEFQNGFQKVPSTTFFGKLFGIKIQKPILEIREFEKAYNWYAEPKNLVKYLKAWLSILKDQKEDIDFEDIDNYTKTELQERLLVALSDEDYILAAQLRDEINK